MGEFTEARIKDKALRRLAAKVRYEIDPANEYPKNYSGHVRVTTRDGRTLEAEQPHLRGGKAKPLSDAALLDKFMANAAFGGWNVKWAKALADYCGRVFGERDLKGMRSWRG